MGFLGNRGHVPSHIHSLTIEVSFLFGHQMIFMINAHSYLNGGVTKNFNENDYVHRMEMWFYWRHSFILSPHGFAHSLLLLYLYKIWLSSPVILYMYKTLWELLETYVTSLALNGRQTTIRIFPPAKAASVHRKWHHRHASETSGPKGSCW